LRDLELAVRRGRRQRRAGRKEGASNFDKT